MTPDELRAARAALHLTQVQLAALLGVSWNAVARWEMQSEKGRRTIPAPAANYIRHLLTCPTTQEPQP